MSLTTAGPQRLSWILQKIIKQLLRVTLKIGSNTPLIHLWTTLLTILTLKLMKILSIPDKFFLMDIIAEITASPPSYLVATVTILIMSLIQALIFGSSTKII